VVLKSDEYFGKGIASIRHVGSPVAVLLGILLSSAFGRGCSGFLGATDGCAKDEEGGERFQRMFIKREIE
jgi:hypothetical protein